ncbi:SRPBCC family protein [Ancylobacter sp. A5.8]|uniref:SRPBCC family protein n=1 Tax=Ancylobacter gelatini TaxID=2919920 RepID=UPI001F4E6BA6|nr:SRPBCC family protein [Ancylobacter gelatini]MCJ8142439.1 SRPBCC family protein [Ancylobacter gelatini]
MTSHADTQLASSDLANGYATQEAADTLRFERLLPGPVERVWSYLTEPDKRRLWLAAGPMELTAGGKVDLVFRNGELNAGQPTPERFAKFAGEIHNEGVVLACEPNRLLRFTWEAGTPSESEVTFELTPRGGKVHLTVTHRRLVARGTRLGVAGGWHAHLTLLADALEGRERSALWPLFAQYREAYEARLAE